MDSIKSFHHAAVSVDNVAVGVQWYTKTLSACVLYQDETWALLEVGDTRIALVIPGEHPPHLAFEWSGAEDFGPLVGHRDGTASLYIEDPFGNKIELMKPQNWKLESVSRKHSSKNFREYIVLNNCGI